MSGRKTKDEGNDKKKWVNLTFQSMKINQMIDLSVLRYELGKERLKMIC